MAARNIYRVTPVDGGWQVKLDGANRASAIKPTKEEAVEYGQILAKNNKPSQLVVYKMNGQFDFEYTYGNDPYPPLG